METALTGPSTIVAVIIIIIRNDIIIKLFLLKTIMSPVMVFSRPFWESFSHAVTDDIVGGVS